MCDKKSLSTADIFLDKKQEEILWVKFRDNIKMELPDARKHADAIIDICGNKPRVFILDSRNIYGQFTPEARKYMAKHKKINRLRNAQALLVNTLQVKIIADYYAKHDRPGCPVRVFSDEKKAKKWVNSFIGRPSYS